MYVYYWLSTRIRRVANDHRMQGINFVLSRSKSVCVPKYVRKRKRNEKNVASAMQYSTRLKFANRRLKIFRRRSIVAFHQLSKQNNFIGLNESWLDLLLPSPFIVSIWKWFWWVSFFCQIDHIVLFHFNIESFE